MYVRTQMFVSTRIGKDVKTSDILNALVKIEDSRKLDENVTLSSDVIMIVT